ncbi:hypothetical protein [Salmonella enterica]|uniref:hypothetical protein n=1 Tax=Salmonella enterica TaxID=28901 RepID=UPI0009739B40|nr:hypothetical protein [Salmonella enterica]APY52887.1 hypothetical protein LFZ7_23000 [Salmonella enterica subsp. enterica serovar Crossness str. 1422-74]
MGMDIFLYSQGRQIVAVPAPYHPVCELGRDFSLVTWVDKYVGEVENSTCLELSREHIQQLKERLDCAIATFTEGNEDNPLLQRRLQYVFTLRDRLESLLSDFDFEHEYLWFYAAW